MLGMKLFTNTAHATTHSHGTMKQEFFIGPHISSTAEVYIGIGKPAEATACTQEAANLFPMSHYVLYMRGQVAELRGNIDEAKRWYEEALSISPTHVKSMQRLVSLESMFISTFVSIYDTVL